MARDEIEVILSAHRYLEMVTREEFQFLLGKLRIDSTLTSLTISPDPDTPRFLRDGEDGAPLKH